MRPFRHSRPCWPTLALALMFFCLEVFGMIDASIFRLFTSRSCARPNE
jgi:hypothetical protein